MLKSPMNYTGGKYRLLSQLLPLFPEEDVANRLFEPFCGGLDVAINYHQNIIASDNIPQIIELYRYWQKKSAEQIIEELDQIVAKFSLSKLNEEGYYSLRSEYNQSPNPAYFYSLVAHSFNHQIRFNSQGHFNMPFGFKRSSFNKRLRKNLFQFIEQIQQKNISFRCCDYYDLLPEIQAGDFVYCDPPYRITLATYNEQKAWSKADDVKLLDFLDELNDRGVLFGMSNVVQHGETINLKLLEWSQKYKVHYPDITYGNCSYHKKNRGESKEVYITNAI